ncbi:hypothetical protein JCGZ_08142 [Jatropha curcas]|uniref:tRNA pseudouridine(55) synthase n=1 Tax=Jatropha curcas TaxID=180498 RepID=A0A067KKT2_JATCU|nr:tRNA pseudouridine synthase Pus10 isoform X2 [Jatropha curcas]KDP36851.1 hypothetical protein JCGZ_08142 [Jatropha curcas]
MSSESEAAHAISPVADSNTTTGDDDMQLLNEAVRSLPSHAVKDLLSIGVCTRCIFRLFGIRGRIYSSSSLLPSIICSILGEPTCTVKHAVNSSLKVDEDVKDPSIFKESEETEPELCRVCLGILQFIYCDDKGITVKKNSAINLALSIAELIKREGHQIDSFSLEVSIPHIILENEQIVHLYMKKKYRSELWFQERLSKCISAKDALKSAIANPLENLLDVKSAPGSCHIRLTYTQAKPSGTAPNVVEGGEGCKRRKTDTDADLESINDKLLEAGNECFDSSKAKGNVFSEIFFNGLEDHESSECVIFPRDKVNAPCHLVFLCYRTPIYFGGRYLKFSRNVSQTRWIIDDERMGETSIEEIIGGNILPMCQGDSYKFHAAGREDIDVRMLGSGRPFLVEIQNARLVPSESLVKEIETKINNFNTELVGVRNLKIVGNQGWNLMHEGEAEKQKQYCALVWISRPIEDQDLHSIINLKDLQILQRTPIRVLHRRSPLEREKIVHWMKIETIAESSQYFLLHLCTQAGTYIKEFVHGDLGRTHPNIGSILGCRAEILQLDVTGVKMDCFLAE